MPSNRQNEIRAEIRYGVSIVPPDYPGFILSEGVGGESSSDDGMSLLMLGLMYGLF